MAPTRRTTRIRTKPQRYSPLSRIVCIIPATDVKRTTNDPGVSQDDSQLEPVGGETSTVQDGRFKRYIGMQWVDDKHIIRQGAEMARTAPKVQELMGTWRWVYRTGHNEIPAGGWQGGIRFRMAGDKGWSYRDLVGRMRYDPRGLRPCAAKCMITGGVKKRDCVEITLDMSDDPQKQEHANIDKIPGKLRFTRQPGRWNEYGIKYSHQRLLCLTFVDPDEGEVEIFGLKQHESKKLDGPRGYPAPPVTTYKDMFEEMNPLFGSDEVMPESMLREFGVGIATAGDQWYRWLGWKGVQQGWYKISKDWTAPAPNALPRDEYNPPYIWDGPKKLSTVHRDGKEPDVLF